jgi:hypothetical protein
MVMVYDNGKGIELALDNVQYWSLLLAGFTHWAVLPASDPIISLLRRPCTVWFLSVGCGLKWVRTYQLAGVGVEILNPWLVVVICIHVCQTQSLCCSVICLY